MNVCVHTPTSTHTTSLFNTNTNTKKVNFVGNTLYIHIVNICIHEIYVCNYSLKHEDKLQDSAKENG